MHVQDRSEIFRALADAGAKTLCVAARNALAPCTDWRSALPGYFAAACAIFVSIRDRARLAAPRLPLWHLLSCDALRGDVGGEGCAADWRLAESLAEGTLAAGADSLAASSRLCDARELGFRRAFSSVNSVGRCVATWARKPAARDAFPQYLHIFLPKLVSFGGAKTCSDGVPVQRLPS